MNSIQKIMVAFDFSSYAVEALIYGAELAETLKADLFVINVINRRDLEAVRRVTTLTTISVEDYIKETSLQRIEKISQHIEEQHITHLSIEKLIKIGTPFEEINKVVRNEGIDLVIMGPKGQSNLVNILFGSNAEKIFRHCPVPLLSIRSTHKLEKAEKLRTERLSYPDPN